jgi:hypothetical protein
VATGCETYQVAVERPRAGAQTRRATIAAWGRRPGSVRVWVSVTAKPAAASRSRMASGGQRCEGLARAEPDEQRAARADAAGELGEQGGDPLRRGVDDRVPRQERRERAVRDAQVGQVADPERDAGEPLPRAGDELRHEVHALDGEAAPVQERGPVAGSAAGVDDGTGDAVRPGGEELLVRRRVPVDRPEQPDVLVGTCRVRASHVVTGHRVTLGGPARPRWGRA